MMRLTSTALRSELDVVVLTGALGSGKTTLLKDFLSTDHAAETAVIVNEAGEIDVDGALIAASSSENPVRLLSNGCICCSFAGDLDLAFDSILEAAAGRPEFSLRRIVIETSGLARPAPILRSIARFDRACLRTRIVSTFDATRDSAVFEARPAYVAQLAAAHAIVATKRDLLPDCDRNDRCRAVSGLNPFADIVLCDDPFDRAIAALSRPSSREAPSPGRFDAEPVNAHGSIATFLVTWDAPIAWSDCECWLEELAGICDGRLLRAKGLVRIEGIEGSVLIDGVEGEFAQPRRFKAHKPIDTGLVLITDGVALEELNAIGAALHLPRPKIHFSRAFDA